jgi:hypothetical protein
VKELELGTILLYKPNLVIGCMINFSEASGERKQRHYQFSRSSSIQWCSKRSENPIDLEVHGWISALMQTSILPNPCLAIGVRREHSKQKLQE